MRLVSTLGSALLALSLAAASPAAAQVSAYVDLTAAKLTSPSNTYILFGPSIGLTATLAELSHVKFGADVRVSFLGGSQRLDGMAIGPRFAFAVKGIKPYAELLAGFARYNDGLGTSASSTTDGQLQFLGGIDRRINNHIDWRVIEYAYEQYYALGGAFNPKNFSTGIVYNFAAK